MNLQNIPNELKQLKQWVCYKGDKIPKNPYTGGNAQSNNPDTWSDFNTAVEACEKYGFDGCGFVFSETNGYFGVDLDHCTDNMGFIDEFVDTLQSYTEFSRSGNGIHIICKGTLPNGSRRKGNVEMYSSARYFIMTGNVYKYTEIKECTESIKPLHSKYLYEEKPKVIERTFQTIDMSDQEIIDRAKNSKSGGVFQLLYSGQWQGLYSSQSEADLAFCNHLAFWCQRDAAKMDRLFRASGLMRDKWDEYRGQYTYGQKTIEQAVSHCADVYEPPPTSNMKKMLEFLCNNTTLNN